MTGKGQHEYANELIGQFMQDNTRNWIADYDSVFEVVNKISETDGGKYEFVVKKYSAFVNVNRMFSNSLFVCALDCKSTIDAMRDCIVKFIEKYNSLRKP